MVYKVNTYKMNVHAVDIPPMNEMSIDDYKEYLQHGLFSVDHHDVLRSEPAGYPLATTQEQCSALLDYLQRLAQKVGK